MRAKGEWCRNARWRAWAFCGECVKREWLQKKGMVTCSQSARVRLAWIAVVRRPGRGGAYRRAWCWKEVAELLKMVERDQTETSEGPVRGGRDSGNSYVLGSRCK